MPKLTADEVISQVSQALSESDGEFIEKIANQVLTNPVKLEMPVMGECLFIQDFDPDSIPDVPQPSFGKTIYIGSVGRLTLDRILNLPLNTLMTGDGLVCLDYGEFEQYVLSVEEKAGNLDMFLRGVYQKVEETLPEGDHRGNIVFGA